MMESGIDILKKVFAGRQVHVSLVDLMEDGKSITKLPKMFRNAVAIHVPEQCKPRPIPQGEAEQQLDWYQLIESCDSSLFMRGLKNKWYLPCVTTSKVCECPYIPHATRNDWQALHAEIGSQKMKCLLIHCSIFVLVGSRAMLQICGPLDKGDLEKSYPLAFNFRAAPKAVKRKRKENEIAKIPPQILPKLPVIERPSANRPLKKMRLASSDGQPPKVFLVETAKIPSKILPTLPVIERPSVMQPSKKIRLESSDGQSPKEGTKHIVANINKIPDKPPTEKPLVPVLKKFRFQGSAMPSHPIPSHPMPSLPMPLSVQAEVSTDGQVHPSGSKEIVKKKKTRRWRNKLLVKQIVDKRRAINGSIKIAHDEILYSSSGWTHFPITHPISHASPNPTVLAILRASVGTECNEPEDELRSNLPRLGQLIEVMMKNHRQCRYRSIVRRMLANSEYDPQKSFVDASVVYQFLRCVITKVLPIELLGGKTNQRIFLSNVRRFVEAGQGTSFTLNDLIQSVQTSKCRWFSHFPSLPVQISLMARLISWLFGGFVKPLIRQHFYATETSYGRNRIFFYSKDVWQKIQHRLLRSMCDVSLRHQLPVLEKSKATDPAMELQSLLLFARLRFVPKKNGSRPIMSTKFRNTSRKDVNDARLLLNTIAGLYAEGMDAKSTHSLHRKWVDFVENRNQKEPVYFVNADIEDAFGSINHQKMVSLLKMYGRTLPNELEARTFCKVGPDGRRSKPFYVIPHFQRRNLEEWVKQMSPGTVVFHAGIRPEKLDVVKILQFAIKSVLEVHVVHHDNTHYQLRRGIPQGSRLSSALCHIYYGHLVRDNLSKFLKQPDDLLIRVVDDFLYLTTNSERAREFHHRMHEGFKDYNAYVNITKSATNLDLVKPRDETNDKPLRKPVWISFCGLQFHTKTLEIRGDYTKYEGTNIIHCITPSAGEPGKLLLKRLQSISTFKIETIYLDARVNRKPTIIRSMFSACLMAAFRFHAIVKHILLRCVPRHRCDKAVNARYLAHTVIKECCSKMVGHVSSVQRRRKDVKIILSKTETAWLCYEAFHRKLTQHEKMYSNVLMAVRKERSDYEKMLPERKLRNIKSWIGRRIPLSFRRMKDRKK